MSNTIDRRLADTAAGVASSIRSSLAPARDSFRSRFGLGNVARRTLGLCLLLTTVFLWTLSSFMASFIFSDNTYDKPFLLVYLNSSVFAFSILPRFTRYMMQNGMHGLRRDATALWNERHVRSKSARGLSEGHTRVADGYQHDDANGDGYGTSSDRLLNEEEGSVSGRAGLARSKQEEGEEAADKLDFYETVVLSFEFSLLWFFSNYFASACLEYTSVASATILTSTSSVWTLIFGALLRVESFSARKLAGVMASLVGIVMTSTIDLTGEGDEDRGNFPHKEPAQVAIGDAMAFLSAVVYGIYVPVMKKKVGSEDRVDMRLCFGLIGVFNLALLWPLFFILHWTGIEPFEMPPSGHVWVIIVINSLSSYVGDIAWAFAMLLTTPLVVTVGLSLTIPLSLVGQMYQYGQYSSFLYWVGAAVVFSSFVFINRESQEEEEGDSA